MSLHEGAPPVDLEIVTDRLRYPEGPIWMADGSVIVVEMVGGTLTRVQPDGGAEVIAELGGGPNGVAIGPDGAAYVCNNGGALIIPDDFDAEGAEVRPNPDYVGGSIQRVDLATGAVTTLYDSCDGRPLNAPNDIVFDRSGGFWFTCFGYSDGANRRMGGVFYARPDGSSIVARRTDQVMPNGIALSPDQTTLYWSDSMLQKLWAADVHAPGEIGPAVGPFAGRPVVTMPGLQWFDSMAVEESGRVCIATLFSGTVTTVDPSDGTYDIVAFPDPVTTNIGFGGADMRDAWVTGSSKGALYRCRWPRRGLRLEFSA
jgi:gluconolactonase